MEVLYFDYFENMWVLSRCKAWFASCCVGFGIKLA